MESKAEFTAVFVNLKGIVSKAASAWRFDLQTPISPALKMMFCLFMFLSSHTYWAPDICRTLFCAWALRLLLW